MIVPLVVIYILANITFQMAVKNSLPESLNCTECWSYTNHSDHVKYFNAFKLMDWYYNPVLWVFVLCFCQALSHIFERKWNIFSSINILWKKKCSASYCTLCSTLLYWLLCYTSLSNCTLLYLLLCYSSLSSCTVLYSLFYSTVLIAMLHFS